MWLPDHVVAQVERVAHVYYVGVADTKRWNQHRKHDELRLLTGWAWAAKSGGAFRQGFKTMTVAYRDAWYSLVSNSVAPTISPRRSRDG